MHRTAILDDYLDVVRSCADWSLLEGRATIDVFVDHLADEDAVARRLAPYEIVVAERERTPFRRSLIERLPRLRLLVATGPVNWSIDYVAASERGIVVCGTEALHDTTPETGVGPDPRALSPGRGRGPRRAMPDPAHGAAARLEWTVTRARRAEDGTPCASAQPDATG